MVPQHDQKLIRLVFGLVADQIIDVAQDDDDLNRIVMHATHLQACGEIAFRHGLHMLVASLRMQGHAHYALSLSSDAEDRSELLQKRNRLDAARAAVIAQFGV